MTARDAAFIDRLMGVQPTTIDSLSQEEFELAVAEDADDVAYEAFMQTERPNW